MVIVTRNHYVLAAKIHHVTLDEDIEHIDIKDRRGRYLTVSRPKYVITIQYSPDIGQNGRDEIRECTITLIDKCDAHSVYRDLVQQIRDQMPDELYLDQAIDRLLNQYSLENKAESDKKEDQESGVLDDRSTKKIRSSRKKKR
jgi:hypothetical protein